MQEEDFTETKLQELSQEASVLQGEDTAGMRTQERTWGGRCSDWRTGGPGGGWDDRPCFELVSPQGLCVKCLVTRPGHYWDVVQPLSDGAE